MYAIRSYYVRGSINYNFNTRPRTFQPFQSVKWLNSPWLRLIKDFNLNYTPSRVSFRTDMDRYYLEKQVRNINNPGFIVSPTFKNVITSYSIHYTKLYEYSCA